MKVYFNDMSPTGYVARSFDQIQPGDIILFSAAGKNRKLRSHDRLFLLAQAIFKKEYQPEQDRANPGITHVAICTKIGSDGPTIVEINRGGLSEHALWRSNFHKKIPGRRMLFSNNATYKFRPLHVFKPTNETFRDHLIKAATDPEARKARWHLGTAIGSLMNRNRTQGSGYDDEEKKQHNTNTHCSAFVVRSMKMAAQGAKAAAEEKGEPQLVEQLRQFYPDIPTNTSPSSLLSYLLDKVEGDSPLFEHNIHLDIDPYEGLQRVVALEIQRLKNKKMGATGAETKANALQEAYDKAHMTIELEDQNLNPLEKATKLFELMSDTLSNKRTQFNPFKQATAFTSAEKYVEQAQLYTQRLR